MEESFVLSLDSNVMWWLSVVAAVLVYLPVGAVVLKLWSLVVNNQDSEGGWMILLWSWPIVIVATAAVSCFVVPVIFSSWLVRKCFVCADEPPKSEPNMSL